MNKRPCVMITFRDGAYGSGPYNSHNRILNSKLAKKYSFTKLMIPRGSLGVFNYKLIKRLMGDIKRTKPDLVHFSGLQLEGFYVSLACKLLSVKSVCSVRGSSLEAEDIGLFKKTILFFFESLTLLFSDLFYANSFYVSSWFRLRVLRYRFFGVIYNLPPSDNFCSINDAKSLLKKELMVCDDAIVVIYTGRVTVDKGANILSSLIARGVFKDKIHLLILGSGLALKSVLSGASDHGYEKNVHNIEYTDSVQFYLKGSDIFISCSKHETLGNSIIEASMSSLPVVAKNTGGIPEIINDGETGILVNGDSIDGYEKALRVLCESPYLRSKMGESGYNLISNKFNEDDICSLIDNLYNELVLTNDR